MANLICLRAIERPPVVGGPSRNPWNVAFRPVLGMLAEGGKPDGQTMPSSDHGPEGDDGERSSLPPDYWRGLLAVAIGGAIITAALALATDSLPWRSHSKRSPPEARPVMLSMAP